MDKTVQDFYKQHGTTKFPKEFHKNGKCHIGNKKDCSYYTVKDNKEFCSKGVCLTK